MRVHSDTGLAAVCCHFNPCRYRKRFDNYRLFRDSARRSSIPLLTVELAFGDEPYELEPGPDIHQIRGGDVMFQKERLWQIGADRLLDEGFAGIVFLDADVVFADCNWPAKVAAALEQHSVVQCFSRSTAAYCDGNRQGVSAVRWFREHGTLGGRHGQAWALSADVLRRVGLYQYCVVGGGDTALLCGALGLTDQHHFRAHGLPLPHVLRYSGQAALTQFTAWAESFAAACGGLAHDVDLQLHALCHGAFNRRDYRGRHRLLKGFNPDAEVTFTTGGPLTWTSAGEVRRRPIADYFRSRKEDTCPDSGAVS